MTTRNKPPRPKAAKAVRAKPYFTVTAKSGIELLKTQEDAEFHQALVDDLIEEGPSVIEPIYTLPRSPDTEAALVTQAVRAVRKWESNRYGRAFIVNDSVRAMIARCVLASAGLVETSK